MLLTHSPTVTVYISVSKACDGFESVKKPLCLPVARRTMDKRDWQRKLSVFGSVRSALLLADVLCWVDCCFGSWVLLGLLCFLRVTHNGRTRVAADTLCGWVLLRPCLCGSLQAFWMPCVPWRCQAFVPLSLSPVSTHDVALSLQLQVPVTPQSHPVLERAPPAICSEGM